MLTKLREPFGKAGLIVAIVALIAALGGGAYAASGGLSGKQKKEVTRIAQTEAKKFAGKNGTNGINGSNGAPGAKGDTGAAGSNGSNGAPGKSIEARAIAKGEPTQCHEQGGVEYEVEESGVPAEICNGQPWTAGGKLPEGATETGTWSFNSSEASATTGEKSILVPYSIPIPLKTTIQGIAKVHFVDFDGDATCTGSYLEPTAPVGMACFYEWEVSGAHLIGVTGVEGAAINEVNPPGGFLKFEVTADHAYGWGSFAVTGG